MNVPLLLEEGDGGVNADVPANRSQDTAWSPWVGPFPHQEWCQNPS